jgi:hypothetical protein
LSGSDNHEVTQREYLKSPCAASGADEAGGGVPGTALLVGDIG